MHKIFQDQFCSSNYECSSNYTKWGLIKCMNALMISVLSGLWININIRQSEIEGWLWKATIVLTAQNAASTSDVDWTELTEELEILSSMLPDEGNSCLLVLRYIFDKKLQFFDVGLQSRHGFLFINYIYRAIFSIIIKYSGTR